MTRSLDPAVTAVTDRFPETVEYSDGRLRVLDQLALPRRLEYVDCRDVHEVAAAIRDMRVRGAPAIGVTAAYGLALWARGRIDTPTGSLEEEFEIACGELLATRPTAVNLRWGIDRLRRTFQENRRLPAPELFARLLEEAHRIKAEDIEQNRRLGELGASLLPEGARVLTHCNAGSLATAGYGTALGVIRAAFEAGRSLSVWVDETRPYLQGARLTAWELQTLGVPYRLVADNMAGHLMASGRVDLVLVGADRISARGDVANKIGTYSLAVLARHHGIPFYVAAPLSTVDRGLEDGSRIPIEERSAAELTRLGDTELAPPGALTYNPAFDVTPPGLVTAIITPVGVALPPFGASLARLFEDT